MPTINFSKVLAATACIAGMVPQENYSWPQVCHPQSPPKGTHTKNLFTLNVLSILKKKVLYECSLGNRVRCSSFSTPQPHYILPCLLCPGLRHPGHLHRLTPLIQPAKRGAAHHRLWDLVWLTGEALQHQQLQPVGTGNQAVGYGILQPPCHHLPDNTCPPPLLHTACKQIKKIWSMTCSSFQFLPLTSPYGDALSAHSNPLCLHMHTWPKNT